MEPVYHTMVKLIPSDHFVLLYILQYISAAMQGYSCGYSSFHTRTAYWQESGDTIQWFGQISAKCKQKQYQEVKLALNWSILSTTSMSIRTISTCRQNVPCLSSSGLDGHSNPSDHSWLHSIELAHSLLGYRLRGMLEPRWWILDCTPPDLIKGCNRTMSACQMRPEASAS